MELFVRFLVRGTGGFIIRQPGRRAQAEELRWDLERTPLRLAEVGLGHIAQVATRSVATF